MARQLEDSLDIERENDIFRALLETTRIEMFSLAKGIKDVKIDMRDVYGRLLSIMNRITDTLNP